MTGEDAKQQLDRLEAKVDMLALAVGKLINALADEDDEATIDLDGNPVPRARGENELL